MADKDGDKTVRQHIEHLVQEEHRLHAQGGLSEQERHRLEVIRVELDQCWDLLRQRRALREFGEDPDLARVRPPNIVENYEQ